MLKDKLLTCAVISAICVVDVTVSMRGDGQYALLDAPNEEFRLYKVDAKRGNANAQFHVGDMYLRDDGCGRIHITEKSRRKHGIKWLKKAAKNGNCEAAYYLHDIYSKGRYCTTDRKKASEYRRCGAELWKPTYVNEWSLESLKMAIDAGRADIVPTYQFRCLRQNADDGDVESAYEVAINYYNGSDVCSRNIVEATKFFKIVADKGSAKAAYALGICYEDQYNHDQALKYYKQCADAEIDLNSSEGISVISAYKLSGLYRDKGVSIENLENAVKYCKIAANTGHYSAKYNLFKLESELEFQCLLRDANNGDFRAAYKLGVIYNDGYHYVGRDAYEAVKYFKIAADKGNIPEAAYMLGECYKSGENAIKYYKKCVDANFRIYSPDSISIVSAYKVAKLYIDKGVSIENLENAVKYCKIAANANYPGAQSNLSILEKELEFQYLLYNANNGDIDAAHKVAEYYRSGDNAIKYYKIAADQGSAEAAYKLGELYGTGSDAKKYYEIAADKGHKKAKTELENIRRREEAEERHRRELEAQRKREEEARCEVEIVTPVRDHTEIFTDNENIRNAENALRGFSDDGVMLWGAGYCDEDA